MKQFANSPHTLINAYMLGPMCSGKTSLIKQLKSKTFDKDTLPTTSEHHEHTMNILKKVWPLSAQANKNGSNSMIDTCYKQTSQVIEEQILDSVKLNIWDSVKYSQPQGGNDLYGKIRIGLLKTKKLNKVGIIVYDVFDEGSFQKVEKFIDEWQKNVQKQSRECLMLIGNKTDLQREKKRHISTKQGLQLAKKHNMVYLQSTAKEDVNYVFESAYQLVLSKNHKQTQRQSLGQKYYIEYSQNKIAEYKNKQQLKSEESIKILEVWQSKLKLFVYCLQQFFAISEKKIQEFVLHHLKRLEYFLEEHQHIIQIYEESSYLKSMKKFISTKSEVKLSKIQEQSEQVPTSIAQQQILSNSYQKQNKHFEQDNTVVDTLIKALEAKKQTQKAMNKKIDEQILKMKNQLQSLVQKIQSIITLYPKSEIDDFMSKFQIKGDSNSQSLDIKEYCSAIMDSRESVEVISNNIQTKSVLQMLSEQQVLQQLIKGHHEILQKFIRAFSKIQQIILQFFTRVKQQYAILDVCLNSINEQVLQNQVFQFLVGQFIDNLAQDVYEEGDFKQRQEIKKQIKKKNMQKIISAKVGQIKQQENQKLRAIYEQLKGLGAKLKKEVIVAHYEGIQIKLMRHQIFIIRSWLNEAKQEAEQKSSPKFGFSFSNFFDKKK